MMTKSVSRLAVILLSTLAVSGAAHTIISPAAVASPTLSALAKRLSSYSARFFLSQTADGQGFARQVLGHRIRTDRDFQKLILTLESTPLAAAERAKVIQNIGHLETAAKSAAKRRGLTRFNSVPREELLYSLNREGAERLRFRLLYTNSQKTAFVPSGVPRGFLASRENFLRSVPNGKPVTDSEVRRLASDLSRRGGVLLGRANLYADRGRVTRNQSYRAKILGESGKLNDLTVDVTLRNTARADGGTVRATWEIEPLVGLRSDAYFGVNRSVELELFRTQREFAAGLGGVEKETWVFRGYIDEGNGSPMEILAEITGVRRTQGKHSFIDFASAPEVLLKARSAQAR